MKLKAKAKPYRVNEWLSEMVPVISERSTLKVKARLWCNYLMDSILLIAIMLSVCLNKQIGGVYMKYVLVSLKLVLYILSTKLNIVDMAIAIKIIMVLNLFTQVSQELTIIESIFLVLHILFAAKLALSCEQRRGDFDERLGLTVPFIKEVLLVFAQFVVKHIPEQFNNLFYPAVAFALAHYCLCHLDNIYNYNVKKMIRAVSMFSLGINFILAIIYLSDIDRVSIIIVGSISSVIISAWLISVREFDNFKIVEENPNGFAEWDYREYFSKLIHLIKFHKEQGNEEILRGFYKYHQHICFSTECPIRYCHELEKEGKEADDHYQQQLSTIVRYIESYLHSQLQIATIKYPNLKRFYIFYTSPSLQALKYCDKQQFIEYREAVRIDKMFRTKNIEFQRESNEKVLREVQHDIELYIEKSNHLWRLLYDDNIDFGRFEKLGMELLDLKDKVISFETSEVIDNSILKLIRDFRECLLNEEVGNLKLIEEEASSKLYNFIEIHTKEYPILIISAESETLEKIENVNASCCGLIGFSKKELLEKKINDILPGFVGNFHTKLLTQRSKELLYEKEKKLWTLVYVVTRSGYVFQSSLHILQLNSMKGRRWSCILTPTNEPNILIITNQEGKIQGMTSNILNISLDITIIGKSLCPGIFDDMMNNVEEWRPAEGHIDHLFDQDYEVDAFKLHNAMIRVKSSVPLIHPSALCVVEIELKRERSSIPKNYSDSLDDPLARDMQWRFNFPNLYSNVNYHNPVNIKAQDQKHYQFIDYGEGINEMRYLNGQIQYKEDKSESSFQKEQTESSLVQIIDFNLKRETYLEVMSKNKKTYPQPLIEFSIWIVVIILSIIGISIGNFMVFHLGSIKHNVFASSLINLDVLKFHYSNIVHSSIQLVYISQGVWNQTVPTPAQEINSKLLAISSLSPLLAQNESYVSTFNLNYQITPSTTFYDILSQFKLQANNILNNPSASFNFTPSGPVYQLMNLSINYVSRGFSQLSHNLLQNYKNSIGQDFTIYYCQFIGLASITVLVLIRLFIIMHNVNKQKNDLLSIYLQVEESIIQRILQKNNTFKFTLKYNKSHQNQEEEVEETFKSDDENERQAKKKIKSMSKIPYFYYVLLWTTVCLGLFTINAFTEVTYINVMKSDLEQIVAFGEANLVKEEAYTVLQYIPNSLAPTIRNQTLINYATNRVLNIYNSQMKFRESFLLTLNQKLLSTDFTDFFLSFWIKNACPYLTNPSCTTDYFGAIKQGGDQYWSMFARKLDRTVSNLALEPTPLPANYYKTFGLKQDLKDMHSAGKFYSEQILLLPHQKMVQQIASRINKTVIQKIIVFSSVLVMIIGGLILYFAVSLRKMKLRIQKVEEIVSFIPFKRLCSIIGFKKYIRNKYKEGY